MKKKSIIIAVIFILTCIIIEIVYSYIFKNKYHSIWLENASCQIPIRMWNPDTDQIYFTDHMFFVEDNENNYIIYGCQLEKFDDKDMKIGIFNVKEGEELIDFDSIYQLEKLLKEKTCLLNRVTSNYEYSRSIFSSYIITGIAGEKYDGYNSYISTLKQNNMCFMEVIIYRDPVSISEKEMKELMLNTNWHQSKWK